VACVPCHISVVSCVCDLLIFLQGDAKKASSAMREGLANSLIISG